MSVMKEYLSEAVTLLHCGRQSLAEGPNASYTAFWLVCSLYVKSIPTAIFPFTHIITKTVRSTPFYPSNSHLIFLNSNSGVLNTIIKNEAVRNIDFKSEAVRNDNKSVPLHPSSRRRYPSSPQSSTLPSIRPPHPIHPLFPSLSLL